MANDCSNRLQIHCDNKHMLEDIHKLFYQDVRGETRYTMMKLVPIPAEKFDPEGNPLVGFFTPMGYWGTRSDFCWPKADCKIEEFIFEYGTANGPNDYWIDTLIYTISDMLEHYTGDTKPKVFIKHLFDVCQVMTAGFMYWEPGMNVNYTYSTDEYPNEIVIGEYKAIYPELEGEMKPQQIYDDLIMKAETLIPDESVPAEYHNFIEDEPMLEMDLPDDYYNEFETPYYSFEERQFIDKYLYGWVITDLDHIQYLYKEDQMKKEEYDRKICVVNIVQEILKPMEILAFDSCLGGNEVWYGGGEALKSVRRGAGNGNGLSGYGIEIDDVDDFYSRLISLYDVLDELIEIIDESKFLADIRHGYIRRFMREVNYLKCRKKIL